MGQPKWLKGRYIDLQAIVSPICICTNVAYFEANLVRTYHKQKLALSQWIEQDRKSKMSIGRKINEFEALPVQTLREFNELFTACKLTGSLDAEVEIGEIVGPANVRRLLVDGKEVIHTFEDNSSFSDLLPEATVGDWSRDKEARKEAAKAQRLMLSADKVETNAKLENMVLTEAELNLDPMEYKILQYFRGCQSPYHTQIEIAKKLGKSVRRMRTILDNMEKKGIIKTNNIYSLQKMIVTVNEEWA